ncbi:MAG: 50S ribosomal protein L6 [Deltaproteobacteria bacterium]|nr:50S ribosomal protein L6 [Deltaproteobacteria bacterium]
MSRIGKKPIAVSKDVQIKLENGKISVKGPKGTLERVLPNGVVVAVKDGNVNVTRQGNDGPSRAKHGLTRALINNMVTGVTKGFERKLEINGVGFRAEVKGPLLTMALGFSHPVNFSLPKGVTATVDKNVVSLAAVDRELLGATAAKVRELRPPEPYKGKGVKYVEEVIKRKVGKTGAS